MNFFEKYFGRAILDILRRQPNLTEEANMILPCSEPMDVVKARIRLRTYNVDIDGLLSAEIQNVANLITFIQSYQLQREKKFFTFRKFHQWLIEKYGFTQSQLQSEQFCRQVQAMHLHEFLTAQERKENYLQLSDMESAA